MDTLTSLIPPQYLPALVFALAVLKALDEIVRAIPDAWLPAHTTVQAIVLGVRKGLDWIVGNVKLPPTKPPTMNTLLAVTLLSLTACKASPEVVALTSLRATAATISDAAKVYHDTAPAILNDAHKRSIAACTGGDMLAVDEPACVLEHDAPVFKAMRKADAALLIYAAASKAGADVNDKAYLQAVNDAIDALAPLGILVKGSK